MFDFLFRRDKRAILSEIAEISSSLQQAARQERRHGLALESILDNQNKALEILARLEKRAPIEALMALSENFALAFLSEPETLSARVLFSKLTDLLTCFDMSLIMDVNEPFNPEMHEACDVRCDPSRPDETVLEIVRPGFLRGGKVLRCASVIVNRRGASIGDDIS